MEISLEQHKTFGKQIQEIMSIEVENIRLFDLMMRTDTGERKDRGYEEKNLFGLNSARNWLDEILFRDYPCEDGKETVYYDSVSFPLLTPWAKDRNKKQYPRR